MSNELFMVTMVAEDGMQIPFAFGGTFWEVVSQLRDHFQKFADFMSITTAVGS